MRTRQFLILLSCLAVLTACFEWSETEEMRPLGQVTRVTIDLPGEDGITFWPDEPDKVITNPMHIELIVAFINEERLGWGGDFGMFGVPVPDLTISLYDGDVLKGHFGVGAEACNTGRGFFETNMVYPFAAKAATSDRCAAFLALLGGTWLSHSE